MKKGKSYNPFKMWGSYVGAYLLGFIITILDVPTRQNSSLGHELIFAVEKSVFWFTQADIFTNILGISIGFLIGWGIHSLIRRFKR